MTDEALEGIISEFNRTYSETGNAPVNSTCRWISADVLWAFLWVSEDPYFHHLYLVKREQSFAGIVYVMVHDADSKCQSDLHIFVPRNLRGQRILELPMKRSILPHLCNQPICHRFNEIELRATNELGRPYADRSERILRKLGFEISETRAKINAWRFVAKDPPVIPMYESHFPFPSREQVVRNVFSEIGNVRQCLSAVECAFGSVRPEKRGWCWNKFEIVQEAMTDMLGVELPLHTNDSPEKSPVPTEFWAIKTSTLACTNGLSAVSCQIQVHCLRVAPENNAEILLSLLEYVSNFGACLMDLLEDIRYSMKKE